MKAKIIISFLTLTLFINAYSQNLVIDLSFTAVNNADYVQLDSIKIMNRTQGSDTTIYWPDTTIWLLVNPGDLMLYVGYSSGFPVGIQDRDQDKKDFYLSQSIPNPVENQSQISLYIPEKGNVTITVTDLQGRIALSSDWLLYEGNHLFRFTPGDGPMFLLSQGGRG